MISEELKVQIQQSLSSLGDSPDEVACSLAKQGIKGRREDASCCPLAHYISTLLEGETRSVEVEGEEAIILDHTSTVHDRWTIPLPYGSSQFVDSFDNGKYPDLVEE